MYPTSFEQANKIFDKPLDMTRDECTPLNTHVSLDVNGGVMIISCWKPTHDEIAEICRTGRVWCYHWGAGLQPHALSGHNPFPPHPAS